MISRNQLRAARTLLSWDQLKLASTSGVAVNTIRRMEAQEGFVRANTDTIRRVIEALEEAGIIFLYPDDLGDVGVRLKKQET